VLFRRQLRLGRVSMRPRKILRGGDIRREEIEFLVPLFNAAWRQIEDRCGAPFGEDSESARARLATIVVTLGKIRYCQSAAELKDMAVAAFENGSARPWPEPDRQ
jgi:hypothetical protein